MGNQNIRACGLQNCFFFLWVGKTALCAKRKELLNVLHSSLYPFFFLLQVDFHDAQAEFHSMLERDAEFDQPTTVDYVGTIVQTELKQFKIELLYDPPHKPAELVSDTTASV